MADRPDSDREVLTSLPRSRPVRRSTKRAERPRTAATPTKPKSKPAAADGTKARKPAAKPRAAARPKAAARTTRPASRGGARATAQRTRAEPRRAVPPAGYASPSPPGDDGRGSPSADLVGTVVQAVGELAQIGFAVGRQTLQSMFDRLPKP